jgi:thiamine biosynthesis lipoprotein
MLHRNGLFVVIAGALLLLCGSARAELQRFEYSAPKMGTVFDLIIWAPDQKSADNAADAAWARVDQLNRIFSDYDPESELNHLSRMTDQGPMTQAVPVSDDMWSLLGYSVDAARRSDGTFDITIGPLTHLQRQSRRSGKLPDPQKLKQAMECVGWRYIKLDEAHHAVQLLHAGMQLDVGGIAKGYTSDQVVKVLAARGLMQSLCGAAGDIAAGDPPPGRDDWRVAIQSLKNPERMSDYVRIRNYGISTSGDTYRSAEVEGKRYSHIIDPRTGLGLTSRIGVTTVAPKGVLSDWTGTAISILGPEKGLEMIERLDGAAARIVTIDEQGNEKVYESKRFAKFLVPPNELTSGAATNPVH